MLARYPGSAITRSRSTCAPRCMECDSATASADRSPARRSRWKDARYAGMRRSRHGPEFSCSACQPSTKTRHGTKAFYDDPLCWRGKSLLIIPVIIMDQHQRTTAPDLDDGQKEAPSLSRPFCGTTKKVQQCCGRNQGQRMSPPSSGTELGSRYFPADARRCLSAISNAGIKST